MIALAVWNTGVSEMQSDFECLHGQMLIAILLTVMGVLSI